MKVRIRLFALARELANRDAVELELSDDANLKDVKTELIRCYPDLAGIASISVMASEYEFIGDDDRVSPEAELALLPPVSGG